MKWKKTSWHRPVGASSVEVNGYTLKGILGATRAVGGWSLVWLREDVRIIKLPRLVDCKTLGARILPLFDDDGQLQDAALTELKAIVVSMGKEAKAHTPDDEKDDAIVEIPKLKKEDLPDQSGQSLPVTFRQLRRYVELEGTQVGADRFRFVRSHYTTAEIIINHDHHGAAQVYEALDVLLWCAHGFDPAVTKEQLIERISKA